MSNKQTAVEWLESELKKQGFLYDLDIEAAKEMEKEQHELTFARGHITGYANGNGHESKNFKQYYNETYGK